MVNLCDGIVASNQKILTNSRAFCEGINARYFSELSTTNPHAANSEANKAWTAGWNTADIQEGDVVAHADAPCCAIPAGLVPVIV